MAQLKLGIVYVLGNATGCLLQMAEHAKTCILFDEVDQALFTACLLPYNYKRP